MTQGKDGVHLPLRLLLWNPHTINGTKELALRHLVEATRANVVIITEADVEADSLPVIVGFRTFAPKTPRIVRVLLLVREELLVEQLEIGGTDIPAVWAKVNKTTIGAVYRQFTSKSGSGETGPAFERRQLDEILHQISEASNQAGSNLIVAGDFNLDPTRRGDTSYYQNSLLNTFLEATDEHGLQWVRTGPTFKSDGKFDGQHRVSTIDLVFGRTMRPLQAETLDFAASDHAPVLAWIPTVLSKPKTLTKVSRDWSYLNFDHLSALLSDWSQWQPFFSETSPSSLAGHFERIINDALDMVIPSRVVTLHHPTLRLSKQTREVMRLRDQARKNGDPLFRQLRNKASSMVKGDRIQGNLQRIRQGGTKAAWSVVKETMGRSFTGLPIPKGCQTNEEAAEMCADHLTSKIDEIHHKIQASLPDPDDPLISRAVDPPPLDPKFQFTLVGAQEIKTAVRSLACKRSMGRDGIPITILKGCLEVLTLPLVHLTNQVITSRTWPTSWKHSIVTPVLKPGKPPSEVSSYRPVSLLCAVSKVVEKVLHYQLSTFAEAKILPPEQHGFRANRSTDTALASVLSAAEQAKHNNLKTALVAFDFSSAFDTIDHRILVTRMSPWADEGVTLLISDYLLGGTQEVRWNGVRSKDHQVQFGVRQGSILGPLLFTILTSTLPSVVRADGVTPSMFADDISAKASGKTWPETSDKVENLSGKLKVFSPRSSLQLNDGKTQVLPLGRGVPEIFPQASSSITLLGLVLDSSLGFSSHHKAVSADVKSRIGVIRRLQVHLPRGRLLNQIAEALVVSKVAYGSWLTVEVQLSSQNQRTSTHPLQILLNNLARVLLGVRLSDRLHSADLLEKCGLPSLNQIVIRAAALAAWKAINNGTLGHLLLRHSDRSRAAANDLRTAADSSIAARNMAACWNHSPELRSAKSFLSAKTVAHKMAASLRRL